MNFQYNILDKTDNDSISSLKCYETQNQDCINQNLMNQDIFLEESSKLNI